MEKHPKPGSGGTVEKIGSSGKRRYVAPALTEYGSIGKLTQGGSGTVGEGAGTMVMAMCL